jgi:hypothetical protein
MESSPRKDAPGERVRQDITGRALGLFLGSTTVTFADVTGDATRGWRIIGLVRLRETKLSHAADHVAHVYSQSPAGTRLVVGCHNLGHPTLTALRQAAPDLVPVILDTGEHARRAADGTWRLPVAALKGAVVAARAAEKLHLAGCEEGAAFTLAATCLRDAIDHAISNADLIMAVGLAMWVAIERSVTQRRILPPPPRTRRAS